MKFIKIRVVEYFLLIFIISFFSNSCSKSQNKVAFIQDLTISSEVITENALDNRWSEKVQTKPENNYELDNGELLLGNSKYPALSYSGYRKKTRGDNLPNKDDYCPTVEQIKEDIKILYAMEIGRASCRERVYCEV